MSCLTLAPAYRSLAEIVLPFLLAALLVVGGPIRPAAGGELRSVALRAEIEVEAGAVRLGDLFALDGEEAGVEVARAPAPGERLLFYPSRVAEIARAHGLSWRNPESLERVVVTRASRTIPTADIVAALEPELEAELDIERVEVELSPRDAVMRVAVDERGSPRVETLSADRRTGRFEARLSAGEGADAVTLAVAGRATALLRVPVPARAIAMGEILRERDLNFIELRADRIPAMTATEAESLVGQEARRPLRVATPVRASDVMQPVVVRKNQIVALVFTAPGIRLTDRGRALENASASDAVRVMNLTSNRVVTGFAAPTGEVLVGPSMPQIASR